MGVSACLGGLIHDTQGCQHAPCGDGNRHLAASVDLPLAHAEGTPSRFVAFGQDPSKPYPDCFAFENPGRQDEGSCVRGVNVSYMAIASASATRRASAANFGAFGDSLILH